MGSQGNSYRGLSKHRKSGKTTKSPKLRHSLEREAKTQDVKASESTCKSSSIAEVFKRS